MASTAMPASKGVWPSVGPALGQSPWPGGQEAKSLPCTSAAQSLLLVASCGHPTKPTKHVDIESLKA